MNDNNSLAHTKWNCKYHIVFAPVSYTHLIINITSSPDIGLDDVEKAASLITNSAHPEANII